MNPIAAPPMTSMMGYGTESLHASAPNAATASSNPVTNTSTWFMACLLPDGPALFPLDHRARRAVALESAKYRVSSDGRPPPAMTLSIYRRRTRTPSHPTVRTRSRR
jgi:hypothetical protein